MDHRDAERARKVLERVGIDIDSAENGVFLRQRKHSVGSTAYHPEIHTDVYLRNVADLLEQAEMAANTLPAQRAEVIATTRDIARRLKANTFPYR